MTEEKETIKQPILLLIDKVILKEYKKNCLDLEKKYNEVAQDLFEDFNKLQKRGAEYDKTNIKQS